MAGAWKRCTTIWNLSEAISRHDARWWGHACPHKVSEIFFKCWKVKVIVNILNEGKLTWKIEFWIIKKLLRKWFLYSTKCFHFCLKCTKIVVGWGSAPDPAGGAYSAPPDPLAVWGWDGEFAHCVPPPPSRNPGYAPEFEVCINLETRVWNEISSSSFQMKTVFGMIFISSQSVCVEWPTLYIQSYSFNIFFF